LSLAIGYHSYFWSHELEAEGRDLGSSAELKYIAEENAKKKNKIK